MPRYTQVFGILFNRVAERAVDWLRGGAGTPMGEAMLTAR